MSVFGNNHYVYVRAFVALDYTMGRFADTYCFKSIPLLFMRNAFLYKLRGCMNVVLRQKPAIFVLYQRRVQVLKKIMFICFLFNAIKI